MQNNEAKYFLIGAILLFLGLFGVLVSGYTTPLIIGLLLTALAYPLYQWLLKHLGGKENAAALLTIFVIVLIIIVPLTSLAVLFSQEALHLFITIQERAQTDHFLAQPLTSLAKKLNIDPAALENQLGNAFKNIGLQILSRLSGLLSNLTELILEFFVMLVTIFYLLRDGEIFGQLLMKASPLRTGDELQIYQTFKKTGRAVFYGNFVSALAQGTLGGLGFWIFGLESPILWGTVMGFLALIPLLGPYLISLPAAVYLFFSGKMGILIGFLLYNFLLVSSIDNIIKPKLIGGQIKVHPFLILLSILGGLKLFGVMGIIYGPLIIVTALTLIDIYHHNNKNTPI